MVHWLKILVILTGKFEASADCWCIYGNMNSKLRDFNTQLIEKIRKELLDVTFYY